MKFTFWRKSHFYTIPEYYSGEFMNIAFLKNAHGLHIILGWWWLTFGPGISVRWARSFTHPYVQKLTKEFKERC